MPPKQRQVRQHKVRVQGPNGRPEARGGWFPFERASGNDSAAGSPTATLLRLLLPLNDRVRRASRPEAVVADLPGPVRTPH